MSNRWRYAALTLGAMLGHCLPGHAASRCDLRPATTWYAIITAGRYRLLFDDDADLASTPQIAHARRGNSFITDTGFFHIAGPRGTCSTSSDIGIVTTPVFIGNERYLYLATYSGGNFHLVLVDAQNCGTIWRSPDLDRGLPVRKPYGFLLPGTGRVVIGRDCRPHFVTP